VQDYSRKWAGLKGCAITDLCRHVGVVIVTECSVSVHRVSTACNDDGRRVSLQHTRMYPKQSGLVLSSTQQLW
jgi:hypothetical protein